MGLGPRPEPSDSSYFRARQSGLGLPNQPGGPSCGKPSVLIYTATGTATAGAQRDRDRNTEIERLDRDKKMQKASVIQ